MATSFGLGPIRDDDELLDRLAAREYAAREDGDDSGLEGVFAAWTRAIDEDEKAAATCVGPLGLRLSQHGRAQTPRTVRVVKVRRARAVAVLGALTLTLYGGGVAAAVSGMTFEPVENIVKRVSPVQVASTPTPIDTAARRAWEMTAEQAKEAARSGQFDRARGMLDVMRKHSQTDAGLAGDVVEVEQEINAAAAPNSGSAAVTAAPLDEVLTQALGATTTAPPEASPKVPMATVPTLLLTSAATSPSGVPGATAPAGAPVVPHATTPGNTAPGNTTPGNTAPGNTAPGTTAGTTPQNPAVGPTAPSAPSSPSPSSSSIGSASGNQSVGNSPTASAGEPDSTTRPSDEPSKPKATTPAAVKPTAVKPTASKTTAIKPSATKPSATKPAATKPTASKTTGSKTATTKTTATKPAALKTRRSSEKAKKSNEVSSPATRSAPSSLSAEPSNATS